jgi:ribosomal protein S18 acetylase RimI-like enzyme
LQENDGKVGQVRFMAVAKNYQGKGLGEKILTQLELVAKEKQLAKIELQARENAVKFYEKNGYSIVQSSFLLWGQIQHYLMQKIL